MNSAKINAASDKTLYLSNTGGILNFSPHQQAYCLRLAAIFSARTSIFDSSEETIFRLTMG